MKGTDPLALIGWHFANPLDISYVITLDKGLLYFEARGFFVRNLGYTCAETYNEGTNERKVFNLNMLQGNAENGCIQRFCIEPNNTGKLRKQMIRYLPMNVGNFSDEESVWRFGRLSG